MRTWIRPMIIEECFVSNENIANSVVACYRIACNVGRPYGNKSYNYSNGPEWNNISEYGNVYHEELGTAGTCADANSNRFLVMEAGSAIQEHNSKQGWLDGGIDTIVNNNEGKVGPGATVYWHTYSKNNDRRWNHKGIIQLADANHPNHS